MAGWTRTSNDSPARVGHLLGLARLVSPAGAGTFDVMEDSLQLLLQFGGPIAIIAMAWGGFQWKLKHLGAVSKGQVREFEEFKLADRERSHALNLKLAATLDNQAIATKAILDFEERRGAQIDSNTQRSRTNRVRIESLEGQSVASTTAKMQAAGIPPELQQEITGQIHHRRQSEASAPTGRKS